MKSRRQQARQQQQGDGNRERAAEETLNPKFPVQPALSLNVGLAHAGPAGQSFVPNSAKSSGYSVTMVNQNYMRKYREMGNLDDDQENAKGSKTAGIGGGPRAGFGGGLPGAA